MLKRAAFPLLGLLLATLAGCASGQSTGATPAYVDGTWMGGTTTGASTMVVVLKQTGDNVTGTLSGAGATVDGPIEGTVDSNSIQLKQQTAFRKTPLLRASCEEISGDLGGTVVKLHRATPYTVDGTWMGSTTTGAKMVVVLKQMGNNVTGTLSGAGTVDGPIEGTVQGKTIQLRERSGFRQTPLLNVSCEQISGPLHDGTAVTLRRIP
jgi:cytoskeletal protein CcmA (bactofilin family)